MKKLFSTPLRLYNDNRRAFQIQRSKSSYVAAFGQEQNIDIFDRHGDRKIEIPLAGEAVSMAWDVNGDNLAIIDDKTSSVTLWDSLSYKISQLNTGMKDHLSVLSWSQSGGRLAIGTSKGNLVIYNQKSSKKVSLLGKHTRRICCAKWNKNNTLVLAGEDKVITINSCEGDLIRQINLRELPTDLQFGAMKRGEEPNPPDSTVSCVLGMKQLYIFNLDDPDNSLELAFKNTYGDIVSHYWFGDGYIMVGFSAGYFIVISTHKEEIGKEIYQVRDHKDGLHDIAISTILNRCSTAGDHCVKVHDLQNVRELTAIIELEEDISSFKPNSELKDSPIQTNLSSCQLQWSEDGQLMAVSTPRNLLHVFLSQLPMLASLAPPNTTGLTARLTSLLEVTIEQLPCLPVSMVPEYYRTPRMLNVEIEPTFIGLGQRYLAVGMNNHAWFYELMDTDIKRVSEYNYLDVVDQICVNESYAAACGPSGKLTLHWIDSNKPAPCIGRSSFTQKDPDIGTHSNVRDCRIFPDSSMTGIKITAFSLCKEFLLFATNRGQLFYFNICDWTYSCEYQHTSSILVISPSPIGTRSVFIDDQGSAFIYNPMTNYLIEMLDFLPSSKSVLWDLNDTENPLLIAHDDLRVNVYRYYVNGYLLCPGGSLVSKYQNQIKNTTTTTSNNTIGILKSDIEQIQLKAISGQCRTVGVTRLQFGHLPLAVASGEILLLSPTGRLVHQPLATHSFKNFSSVVINSNSQVLPDPTLVLGLQDICDKEREVQPPEFKNQPLRKRSDKRESGLNKLSQAENLNYFEQALRVGCFEDAAVFAEQLNADHIWNQLGMASLRVMQFDIAIRAFRRLKHPGLVLAVQRIKDIEDHFLLAGYVAMILKEFDEAQDLFLASSQPIAALEMRRDLLHWDSALQLARTLAPQEIPFICREYAAEMECIGDYVNALMHYERALGQSSMNTSKTDEELMDQCGGDTMQWEQNQFYKSEKSFQIDETEWRNHVELCNAGIARNTIRLGDMKRGIEIASKSGNPSLQKECADILDQSKWQEAASLYEMAGCYEAAVTVYLRCKNHKRAGELLSRVVNAPRLHLQYAKARESEGAYKIAVLAYEAAQDWDSVVRLQLDKLGNAEEAVRVVRETHSIEGARMIAHYFTRTGDHAQAIQFLVLSKCFDTAFELARKHRKMELYAEAIGLDASTSEYQSIACYFENEKNWYLAGKYALMAKQYEKAVRHLLRAPYSENSPALDLALEAVGLANDSRLTHLLIVYLMGETDGVPKDARHLFRLYMVLKQYKEAARTAVIIAREEQTAGNYRSAHELLFSMVQELRQRDLRVPSEMTDNLSLLHSYILAKVHVKNNEHLLGARMLIRVAENISKFPSHIVPILTSTVIECQKAGLKSASFGYAAMLLRPEYRDKLDPKYRRKFENLVRRPDRKMDTELYNSTKQINTEHESCTPCPSCGTDLIETSLYCTDCRNNIPYCVITGYHVLKNDFTTCPGCHFPAIYSAFMRYVENTPNPVCPMCSITLSRENIRRIVDPAKILDQWITSTNVNLDVEDQFNETPNPTSNPTTN